MTEQKKNSINRITYEFHDSVDIIYEEFMDGNKRLVKKEIDELIENLKNFKSNLDIDEVQGTK